MPAAHYDSDADDDDLCTAAALSNFSNLHCELEMDGAYSVGSSRRRHQPATTTTLHDTFNCAISRPLLWATAIKLGELGL